MIFLSRMLTQLLANNHFINEDERHDIQASFDKSFEESAKNQHMIAKAINSFMSHPLGVMAQIGLFVWISRKMREIRNIDDENALRDEFKRQYEQKLMEDLIKDK